jgi:tape measure domain-containing protein
MAGKFTLAVTITAFDKITAPLKKMTAGISRLTHPVTALSNRFAALGRDAGVPRLADNFRNVHRAVSGVGDAASTTAMRIAGIGVAAGGLAFLFKRQFVDVAADFEQMQVRLESLEGGTENARKAFDVITGMSNRSPFAIDAITEAFARLRLSGLDPTTGSLDAILNGVSKFAGPSTAMLERVSNAFGQMASKTVISSEEMTQQLAEAGIPAWQLLSRAIERVNGQKLEVSQLRKLAEQGALGSKWIPELIKQLGIESEGSAEKMSKTFSGALTRLGTKWKLFKREVMDAGPFRQLAAWLNRIVDKVDQMAANGELTRWATWLAQTFLVAFGHLERAFVWLREKGPGILAQISSGLQTAFTWADKVAVAVGGWGNLLAVVGGAYVFGPLIMSIGGVVAAVAALNLALAGTPAGWLLLGAGALAAGGFFAWSSTHDGGAGPRGTRGRRPWPGAAPGPGATDDGFALNVDPAAPIGDRPVSNASPGRSSLWDLPIPSLNIFRRLTAEELEAQRAASEKWGRHGAPAAWVPPATHRLVNQLANLRFPTPQSPLRFNMQPGAPAIVAAPAAGPRGMAASRDQAHVVVDFRNTPRGVRTTIAPGSTADVEVRQHVNLGRLMPEVAW